MAPVLYGISGVTSTILRLDSDILAGFLGRSRGQTHEKGPRDLSHGPSKLLIMLN